MLFLANHSPFEVELERGQPVAIAIDADAWNPSEAGAEDTATVPLRDLGTPHQPRDLVMMHTGCPYVEPIPSDDPMAGFRLASGRLDAPAYLLEAEHRRIAQPWDLKRGTKFNVLVEPGRSLVKQVADASAVLVEAPECKTLSRARDRPIPGVDRQPLASGRMNSRKVCLILACTTKLKLR